MTQSTTPPKPTGTGGMKYAVAGILLITAAGASWLFLGQKPAPAPRAPVEPPATVERSTSLAAQELLVEPNEDPKADEPAAAQPAKAKQAVTPKPKRGTAPSTRKVTGTPGPWDCDGDMDANKLRSVLAEHRTQVRHCYEKRLKVNNVLQGNIDLRLKIDASGRVTATKLSGSLRDADVHSCVRALATRWIFSAPTGGSCAVVDVPFNFTPLN